MPDLNDGESVEVQGSGAKPYILKNVGGVYSCTCPAWRNQSQAIERRTCKHLRKLRGDAAEEARLGADLPQSPPRAKPDLSTPPLLLAESWDGLIDPAGWWLSEKLDGVRAFWDGRQFLSRLGNPFHAPEWFIAGLPDVPLDGELWLGRKMFQRAVSIVRRQDKSDHWKELRYVIFDAPRGAEQCKDLSQRCCCRGACREADPGEDGQRIPGSLSGLAAARRSLVTSCGSRPASAMMAARAFSRWKTPNAAERPALPPAHVCLTW